MKKPNLLSLAFAAMSAATAIAAPLTPQQALQRAGEQMQSTLRTSPSALRFTANDLAYTVKDSQQMASIYVFAHRDAPGFILIGADEVAAPVIGYSDRESFSSDNIPCGLEFMLEEYSKEIAAAKASGAPIHKNMGRVEGKTDYAPIAPICATKWNQGEPYFNLAPLSGNKHCYTGCVATAMAQVMKKHNYPVKGSGSHSYTWSGKTLTYNYADSTFEWDKMTDTYSADSKEDAKYAVANLMSACGIAVNMQYSTSGSGAYSQDVAPAMIQYFKYSPTTTYITRAGLTLDSWNDMAIQSLKAGCPIYVSGQNSSAGHAFVCDGYSENGFFHINWGWGGSSDGYFRFTALDPSTQGIGGSNAGYNINEAFTIMAQPDSENAHPFYLVYANAGVTPKVENDALTLTGPYRQTAESEFKGYMAIQIKHPDGKVEYLQEADQRTFVNRTARASIKVDLPKLDDGLYELRPYINVATPENPEWQMIYLAAERAQFGLLKVENGVASAVENQKEVQYPEVTNEVTNSRFYIGFPFSVSGKMTNPNVQVESFGLMYACLLTQKGELATYANPMTYDVLPGDSWNFTYNGSWRNNPEPGEYYLFFCATDAEGYLIPLHDGIEVTVANAPEGTPTIKLSNFQPLDGAATGVNSQTFTCDITGVESYFASNVTIFLFKDGKYQSMYYNSPTLFVDKGETKSYSFTTTWSLQPETDYKAQMQAGNVYLGTAPFRTGDGSGVSEVNAAGNFNITCSDNSWVVNGCDAMIENISVYGIDGSTIQLPVANNGNEARIETAMLPSGIYLLRVATSAGIHTERILKK